MKPDHMTWEQYARWLSEKRQEDSREDWLERERLRAALRLIAAPMRPDGTYNRDRRACELLAKETLES